MRPFTSYGRLMQQFPGQSEKLVAMILELVQADAIYLLAATVNQRRTESIFQPEMPTAREASEYFFLVLIGNTNRRSLSEWQDLIEQRCIETSNVLAIVLETETFSDWLIHDHLFARKVVRASALLYATNDINFRAREDFDETETRSLLENSHQEALQKAREFIVGAELFKLRNQNKLAAFMLHQAVEQALRSLVKLGTGFHQSTHNLDRLLRYASMISYRMPEVFPRKTEKEKKLFSSLQRAYIDARYSSDYSIHHIDLEALLEKVKKIVAFSGEFRNEIASIDI